MKLTDIVTEQQLDELDAASIGRGIGSVAKGVGAVASIPQGIGRAVKKGYQAGVNTIAGDSPSPAAAADNGADNSSGGFLSSFKAGLKGKAPGADAAASKDALAQITQLISQLAPADIPAVSALLQKGSTAQPAAAAQKAVTPKATAPAAPKQSVTEPTATTPPATEPTAASEPVAPATTPPAEPGASAFGQMANTLTKEPTGTQSPPKSTALPATPNTPPANGKLTPAQQAAMKAKLQGQRAAGKTAGTAASGFNKYTKDASSQRIVGANPDGSPKIQQIKASKINTGNNLSEMLAANIEKQKTKLAEERAANYKNSSIFTK